MGQVIAEPMENANDEHSKTVQADTRIIRQHYRTFTLLARHWKGAYRGRLWDQGKLLCDIEGPDLETLVSTLKQQADDLIHERYQSRAGAKPTETEYAQALKCIRSALTSKQTTMLSTHANCPERQAKLSTLQLAAGYAAATDAMLAYADASRLLADALGYEPALDTASLQTPSLTLFLEPMKGHQADSDLWTMHGHIANIVKDW